MIQTIITWNRERVQSLFRTDPSMPITIESGLPLPIEFNKYLVAKDTDGEVTVESVTVVDPVTDITKYIDTYTRVWTNIDSARAWVEFIKPYGTISAEVIET